MAIIEDKKRNKYYINYKWKTPAGEWKNINIKNKTWIISGPGKVGIKYMRSIEQAEIQKDKEKRNINWHSEDSIPLSELIELYCDLMRAKQIDNETIYNYKLIFKNYLFPIVSDTTYTDKAFTIENIDKFRINLVNCKLATSSINQRMNALRQLITLAKKRKFMSRDIADELLDLLEPLKGSKKHIINDNYFKNGDEDFKKFIDTFNLEDSEWKIPILTMFYGALRIGEWQAITRKDCNFSNDTILINKQIDNHGILKHKTKNGEEKIIRLPGLFMNELEKYINERMINQNDYIFTNSKGSHISRRKTRDIMNKHIKLANIPHITPHGLRHSFATRMFDKGYDLKEVQEHLRHTSLETTMRHYIHYTQTKSNKDLNDLL